MKRLAGIARLNVVVVVMFFSVGCGSLGSLGSLLLSNADAAAGIKDALSKGLFRGFDALGSTGSSDYALLQFVMPGEAQDIIRTLNSLGLGPVVNRVTEKFNLVITGSVQASKPILINSIKQMTIGDALGILVTSNKHAATDYFKNTNYQLLINAINPVVDSNLRVQKANVDWNIITAAYNILPVGRNKPLEKDPTSFISARIIDGLCQIIANEEENIRDNIAARTTDAMRRAFGYADAMKQRGGNTTTFPY